MAVVVVAVDITQAVTQQPPVVVLVEVVMVVKQSIQVLAAMAAPI
jgi:hypothetical protein